MENYLSHKEKGLLGLESRSQIECWVCPGCGRIELRAKNLEVFRDC